MLDMSVMCYSEELEQVCQRVDMDSHYGLCRIIKQLAMIDSTQDSGVVSNVYEPLVTSIPRVVID